MYTNEVLDDYYMDGKTSTTKVALNKCYGGFGVSKKAAVKIMDKVINRIGYNPLSKIKKFENNINSEDNKACFISCYLQRHDPALIEVIEEMGEAANGDCALLEIEEINSKCYKIEEYDGYENIKLPIDDEWNFVNDLSIKR